MGEKNINGNNVHFCSAFRLSDKIIISLKKLSYTSYLTIDYINAKLTVGVIDQPVRNRDTKFSFNWITKCFVIFQILMFERHKSRKTVTPEIKF